jgi:hypothetical protein
MKYLKCSCPHCTGHVEYPSHAGGKLIDCPHCGQSLRLTYPRPPVLAVFLILGCLIVLVTVLVAMATRPSGIVLNPMHKPAAEPKAVAPIPSEPSISQDVLDEADRVNKALTDLGFCIRSEYERPTLKVFVGPAFYFADAREKETGMAAIYIHNLRYYPYMKDIRIIDNQSARNVGRFTSSKRLEIF